MLAYSPSKSPIQTDCEINLKMLYPAVSARDEFEKKLDEFLCCDVEAGSIYELDGDRLRYRTEHLIPRKKDDRIPLLLILGNPASHSITSGMFFSPDKDGEENRFWKHLLGRAGIKGLAFEKGLSTAERNKMRMEALLTGNYESAFRIGLCVFISLPSSAGGKWSGVAGVKRLFGKRAFDQVMKEEIARVSKEAANFLLPNGIAVTFQKDAWNGLSSGGDYNIELARAGKLQSSFKDLPELPIYGVPPTRLLGASREVLQKILTHERINSVYMGTLFHC